MSTTEIFKFKCRYINKNMMQQTTLTNETFIYVECRAEYVLYEYKLNNYLDKK